MIVLQIDLQASARAHRIGQTRPVKIIRMVSKATVEEVILARAAEKLRLTQTVIAKGPDQGNSFKDCFVDSMIDMILT